MAEAQNLFMYAMFAIFGFIGIMFLSAMLFGNRIIKKWEFEAEFCNERGREIGEFEVELSRLDKKDAEFALKVDFKFRHPALQAGSMVQVYLDDALVLEGESEAGRVKLGIRDQQGDLSNPQPGQLCRVETNGRELAQQVLRQDH